ncbi:MAG: DUF2281 domain-containing protein [Desulfobacterales bacterium]|jgi:hypothetical protein|nr:DUF2281 domain-containing protein [Desulfobacterales bacterium]
MIQQHGNDTAEILLGKIRELPQTRVLEVIDFVDFLRSRSQKDDDPILDVIGCLSGKSLSAQELEEELYGRDSA